MATIPGQRYRTGEACTEGGRYEFDGFVDESSELLPQIEEMEVSLSAGQRFPSIRSRAADCYWKPSDEQSNAGDSDAGSLGIGE